MSKNILDLVCESQDIDKSCSFRGDTYDDPSSHDQEWGGGGHEPPHDVDSDNYSSVVDDKNGH